MMIVLVLIGGILIAIGAVFDLLAAIGMIRLPDFYTRLHALTVGAIGGAVLPLIGVALVALGYEPLGVYRWYMAGASIVTALLILILAPTGSHVIARAAYRSRAAIPSFIALDHLAKKMERSRR